MGSRKRRLNVEKVLEAKGKTSKSNVKTKVKTKKDAYGRAVPVEVEHKNTKKNTPMARMVESSVTPLFNTNQETDQDVNFENSGDGAFKPAKKAKVESPVPAPKVDDVVRDPGARHGMRVKNREVRQGLIHRYNTEKKKKKRETKDQRKLLERELGKEAVPKQVPRTLESMRELDETVVLPGDKEVMEDEAQDELASYFLKGVQPKVMITTCVKPCKPVLRFAEELNKLIPESEVHKRGTFELKQILEWAGKRGYTDLIVLEQTLKKATGMLVCHLPNGPTAKFRLSSIKLGKSIQGHANPTDHLPEVALNNFQTRLGHTIGRLLGAWFPQSPEFYGRQIVTFHNQRDFIFFRRHRYIFESKEKARLQEIGPRFTLKLQWLQSGTFDTKNGVYEWYHRKELDTSRRRFFL